MQPKARDCAQTYTQQLAGNYTGATFTVASDGAATPGTLVTAVTACFRAGTRIATERGDVPIEQLRVGDLVLSKRGGAVPVVWRGHRSIDCRRHPRPQDVWPVRIQADAFGEDLPLRDLWLSPDHAVFIYDVLIPIRLLINGDTVVQQAVDEVVYYHIELRDHDVILAEGLPAESYLDLGNRGAFDNGGGALTLHPDFATRVWERDACAELILGGPVLEAVRRQLLIRAEILGHARIRDADPYLLVDGEILRPRMVCGGLHRFALTRPAFDELRLVSRAAMAPEGFANSGNPRRLGVMISGIAVFRPWQWQQTALADLPGGDGLYGLEAADEHRAASRWTDGNAKLHLPAALRRDGILLLDILIAAAAEGDWVNRDHSIEHRALLG